MTEAFVDWGMPIWAAYTTSALIQAFLLLNVVAVGTLIFIWMERKVSARIQDRLGPTRVGGKFGWLQSLADGIKLLTKEDVTPANADPLLYKLAPYIAFAATFSAYIALPFSAGWSAVAMNCAVFYILAILGLGVFGVILGGYASGSKWSLFGAMRESAQVVSYEAPLALCVVVPAYVCGSMDLHVIGEMQAGWFTNWLIFHDPFTFLIFWVYFTCAVASVNRAPFDLAEAESELVAGFHTEYSGLRWSLFFMAEYGAMTLVSGLASILFFGGWNGPIPVFHLLGWADGSTGEGLELVARLFGLLNFIAKCVFGVVVMIWIRWSLPRLRIDQVLTTCLKYCIPLAAIGFVGAALWNLFGVPFINDLAPHPHGAPAGVRERWVERATEPASAGESTTARASLAETPLSLEATVDTMASFKSQNLQK
jgi:NADH-quinone oxidoreductase subunit H